MTAEEPNVVKTGRYSRKETAEKLKISQRTLDRHTEGKKIHCKYRRVNKRPFYEGSEIIRYWKSEY